MANDNTIISEKISLSFVVYGLSYKFEIDKSIYDTFENKNPEIIYRVLYPNTLPWYSEKEDK